MNEKPKKIQGVFVRKPVNKYELDNAIDQGNCKISDINVVETIIINDSDFALFTNGFYNKFLSFNNKGGSIDGINQVTSIVNKESNESLLVNCEGFDYPRYVGYYWSKDELFPISDAIYNILHETNKYTIPNKKDNRKLISLMKKYIWLNDVKNQYNKKKGDN